MTVEAKNVPRLASGASRCQFLTLVVIEKSIQGRCPQISCNKALPNNSKYVRIGESEFQTPFFANRQSIAVAANGQSQLYWATWCGDGAVLGGLVRSIGAIQASSIAGVSTVGWAELAKPNIPALTITIHPIVRRYAPIRCWASFHSAQPTVL